MPTPKSQKDYKPFRVHLPYYSESTGPVAKFHQGNDYTKPPIIAVANYTTDDCKLPSWLMRDQGNSSEPETIPYEDDLMYFLPQTSYDTRKLIFEVRKAMDGLDTQDSFIYDAIPDPTALRHLVEVIYKTILPLTQLSEQDNHLPEPTPDRNRIDHPLSCISSCFWIKHLIELLLYIDISNRRQGR